VTIVMALLIAWTALSLVAGAALGSFVARSDRRERHAARELSGEDRRAA
jgi:uncharacterized protein YneF (UPF0154 family)